MPVSNTLDMLAQFCLYLFTADNAWRLYCRFVQFSFRTVYMSSPMSVDPLLIPEPLRAFWYPRERWSAATYRDMLSYSKMNFVGLIIMSTIFSHASGVCAPFEYIRNTPCAENLAANDFTSCGTINMTMERSFCELQLTNDVVHLESFVRVLGYKTVRTVKSLI